MSIMATMLVKLFYSQCSIYLSNAFLQHRKISKKKKQAAFLFEREPKNSLVASAVRYSSHNISIVAILLVNAENHSTVIVLNQFEF